jgi:hypothetical protein
VTPRRPAIVLILAGLAGAASAQAAASSPILPGYWESTSQVLSPIHTTKVERRCIAARDVDRFMTCYINHHYTCDCPDRSYDNGQIRFHGICVDNKGAKVKIAGEGSYTPTTLHMTAEFVFKLGGLPIGGRASTDARRLGDICPPDAIRSR